MAETVALLEVPIADRPQLLLERPTISGSLAFLRDIRLSEIPRRIGERFNGSPKGFASQHDLLSKLDAEGNALEAEAIARGCTHEAAVWERLREWLEAPTRDADHERTGALKAERSAAAAFSLEVESASEYWTMLAGR